MKTAFYAYILLDRSGSMESCRDITIDAFNEYVMGLRRSGEFDARLTLTTFDSTSIDTLAHAEPAKNFLELNRQTYVPRASTPLLDAVGHAVAEMDKVTPREGEKFALVILTDGHENASKEHTKETIGKLLADRQATKNWLVTFLAADIDSFAEAQAIGIAGGSYMAYAKGSSRAAMRSVGAQHGRFARTGKQADAAFTDEERQQSKPE